MHPSPLPIVKSMKRRVAKCLSLTFVSLCLFAPLFVSAQESSVKFDIDNDGFSEILLLTIDGSDNVDWQLLSSASGYSASISDSSNFGNSGLGVAAADWDGDGSLEFAYVDREAGKDASQWTIQSGAGSETFAFGKKKAVVVAGFNADGGAADAATIMRNGNVSVRLNPLQGNERIDFRVPRRWTRSIRSGKATPTYLTDSSGARLGVVYRNSGRTSRLRLGTNNFSDGAQNSIALSTVPRGTLVEAVEILDGQGDAHVLTHEKINNQQARVRIFSNSGSLVFGDTYSGDTVLVGVYTTGSTGEQFAVQNGTSLTVVSPFGGSGSTLTIPTGVAADLANVNQFSVNGGGGNNTGGSNPGLNSVCPSISSFGGGKLWKPDSDVSDNRGGKPVMLLTGGNKTSRSGRKVYDREGNVICSGMTFKSSSIPGVNKGADHYFSGWIGGCSLSGGQMAARARANTGSTDVWVQWKTNSCLKVGNPDERHGGI